MARIWDASKGCWRYNPGQVGYTGAYNVYYDTKTCEVRFLQTGVGIQEPNLVLFRSNVQQCDLEKVRDEANEKCRFARDPWQEQQAAGTPLEAPPAQAVNVQAAALEDVPTQRPPVSVGLLALGAVGGLAILYLAV